MEHKGDRDKCRRREQKGILTESPRRTGRHGKKSIMLLNRKPKRVPGQRSGLALSYGHEVTGFPNVVLNVTDRPCTKPLLHFSYLSW